MRLLETRKCTFCGKQVDIYHKKRLEAKNTFCSKNALVHILNLNI